MKKGTLVDIEEHVAYYGATMTGKTTLARFHARLIAQAEYDVYVYDPVGTATAGGGWPENTPVIDSPEKFSALIDGIRATPERPAFFFVDESPDIFAHAETWSHLMPRKVRHRNIYLRIISNRPHMIHPSVRSQCSVAYIFRLANEDMRLVLADFGHSLKDVGELEDSQLDRGDALVVESGRTAIERFNVFSTVDRHTHSQPER